MYKECSGEVGCIWCFITQAPPNTVGFELRGKGEGGKEPEREGGREMLCLGQVGCS